MTEPEQSWETIPSAELAMDQRDALHDFREALEKASERDFHIIPDRVFFVSPNSEKPENVRVQARVEETILHQGDNLYLSEDYGWLKDGGPYDVSVIRTAKAETSAHGVFFVALEDPETGNALPVAVKPCSEKGANDSPKNPNKAYIDWLNNQMIGQAGRQHFSPVGFLIEGDKTFSISELKADVETLENSDWRQVLVDENDPQYEGQRAVLPEVGRAMADLHADGIIHGDPQFKNIAIEPKGQVYFVDWESATFTGGGADEELKTKQMAHDLKVIIRSIGCNEQEMGVGLLSGFSSHLQWEYFKKYIFDPYMETMLERDSSEEAFDRLAAIEDIARHYVFDNTGLAKTRKSLSRLTQGDERALDKDFSTQI
ncbi:MAG TPA: lipopolysaccharide kinase InaA family protein [Candidatus Saccharimonadales bacterium]|nr:lipopolysaccharide kinase InaA family protein [Candidatus Saccharimonadales bacterium]